MEFARIGPAAVPLLTNKLADASATVRKNAVLALGGIGPEAKMAVPALTGLLAEDDLEVRKNAVMAARGDWS